MISISNSNPSVDGQVRGRDDSIPIPIWIWIPIWIPISIWMRSLSAKRGGEKCVPADTGFRAVGAA